MLAVRRTVHNLNANPLYLTERAILKQRVRPLWHWNYSPIHLLLLAGLLAAAFPLWFYITTDYTRLLAAFAVVIFAGHFVINTRTLVIAARAMSRDLAPDRWHTLISGDLDARQIVLGKWWAVVRHVWRWHLLTGVMNAGLALALAQHIHDAALRDICSSPFHFLCYVNPYPNDPINAQPALYKGVLAVFIVTGYSVLEPGLIAALGFLAALVARIRRVSPVFVAVIFYLLLITTVIGLTIGLDWYTTRLISDPYFHYYYYYRDLVHEVGIINAGVVGLPLIGDGGTLVAANLMRPYEPSGFNTVRNLIAAVVSLTIYGTVIAGILRLVRLIAVRWGAVPPPKRSYDHLKRWFINPIAYTQRRIFRQNSQLHNRWLRVMMLAVFALLLFIVWLPRWYYPLYCDRGVALRLITGMVFAAHGAVCLRTLLLATNAMRRDAEGHTWSLLALTLVDSRQLVLGKWWAVLRSVWSYHVAVAALKLGLLYGLAQYMIDTPIRNGFFTPLERTFSYVSAYFAMPGCAFYPAYPTQRYHYDFYASLRLWRNWVIILLAFSLLEAALLSAVGIVSALLIRRNGALQMALAIFLRAAPILLSFFVIQMLTTQIEGLPGRYYHPRGRDLEYIEPEWHSWQLALETTQIALSTQFDGGLVSVNLVHVFSAYSRKRQLTGIALGLLLYLLLTLLALRAAEKLAIRRGALAPP
jgi:hypothetical protein